MPEAVPGMFRGERDDKDPLLFFQTLFSQRTHGRLDESTSCFTAPGGASGIAHATAGAGLSHLLPPRGTAQGLGLHQPLEGRRQVRLRQETD